MRNDGFIETRLKKLAEWGWYLYHNDSGWIIDRSFNQSVTMAKPTIREAIEFRVEELEKSAEADYRAARNDYNKKGEFLGQVRSLRWIEDDE